MRHRLLFFALPALWASSAHADKVAVLPTQFDESSKGEVPKLFDDYVLTAVQNIGGFEVVGQEDISTILGFEKQKDIFNCDDTSCIADIGGALGVDKIMVVKIAKLGTDWIATAKLINIKMTRVEARMNEIVKGDTKALLEAVPRIVARLFNQAPPPTPPPSTTSKTEAARPGPTSKPAAATTYNESYGSGQRTAGVVLLLGGAVLAAVGGILLTAVLPEGSSSTDYDSSVSDYGCYYDYAANYLCSYDYGYDPYQAYLANGASGANDFGADVTDEVTTIYGYAGAGFLLVAGLVLEGVGAVLRGKGAAKAELATESATGSSPLTWIGWVLTVAAFGAPIYAAAAVDEADTQMIANIWGWGAGGTATLCFLLGAFVGISPSYAALPPATPTIMLARTAHGGVLPTYGFGLKF